MARLSKGNESVYQSNSEPPFINASEVRAGVREHDAAAIMRNFDRAAERADSNPAMALTAVRCILEYVFQEIIQDSYLLKERYQPWGGDLPLPKGLLPLWEVANNFIGLNEKTLCGPHMRCILDPIVSGIAQADAHAGCHLQRPDYQLPPTEARLILNLSTSLVLFILEGRPKFY